MNFAAIIIGDEILSGRREDKHLGYLAGLLHARGLTLAYAHFVGDEPARITQILRDAFASGDAVFCFGGIGATPDDHTRLCAAHALKVPAVLHPDAATLIHQQSEKLALKLGQVYERDHPDNIHRLNMGVIPQGARLIPNPFNQIPGFACDGERGGAVHFVPGFPVMAWPMVEWVLDTQYANHFAKDRWQERSVIVMGAIEAKLTPLMQAIEREYPVKVFSLPSVDHPQWGRHIDLGVKGAPDDVCRAFQALRSGLELLQAALGPELVR